MAFQKKDFPLYFQKVIWVRGDNFLQNFFFLKKPNTPEYAQVLVVMWAKPNSVTALLSPRPTLCIRSEEDKEHCVSYSYSHFTHQGPVTGFEISLFSLFSLIWPSILNTICPSSFLVLHHFFKELFIYFPGTFKVLLLYFLNICLVLSWYFCGSFPEFLQQTLNWLG